jgi:hypothetical protein
MASQVFVLDASSAGAVIGPANGFITDLKMTKPPAVLNPLPRIGAHFTLRDDRPVTPGLRNLISYDPVTWGNPSGAIWRGASVSYVGVLQIVSVPPGSTRAITLSDIPSLRRKAA